VTVLSAVVIPFLVGALAVSFWSWMRTHRELLKTCRERDEARERLRHAEAELMEAGFRWGKQDTRKPNEFQATVIAWLNTFYPERVEYHASEE